MIRNRWMVAVILTSTLALNSHVSAFANVRAVSHSSSIAVQGSTWGLAQTATVGGSPYISLTTIRKLFQRYGFRVSFTKNTLQLQNLPRLFGAAKTVVDGKLLVDSPTAKYTGAAYVDISALAHGLAATVNYQDGSKTLSVEYRTQAVHSTASKGNGVGNSITLRATSVQPIEKTGSDQKGAEVTTPVVFTIRVVDNGTVVAKAHVASVQSQTYVRIGDLQQVLRYFGFSSTWNGKVLVIPVLPRLIANGTIRIGQDTSQATLLQVGQDWYIPAKACSSLGFSVQVDASHNVSLKTTSSSQTASDQGSGAQSGTTGTQTTVNGTLLDANGNPVGGQVLLQTTAGNTVQVAAQSDGHFQAQIATSGGNDSSPVVATVIGAMSDADDWVGLAQDVAASDESSVRVQAVQRFTALRGHLDFTGASFPVTEVSIRSVLTHVHYYAPVDANGNFSVSIPVGAYEVFALLTKGEPVYVLQPFDARENSAVLSVPVDPLPTGNQISTAHTRIVVGDKGVAPEDLLSIAHIAEHVYPTDMHNLGISAQRPIVITLYSTIDAYREQFIADGYSASDATQYAQNSAAVSEGTSDIRVCMEHFGEMDGLNLLAHEMTHALIANVSADIPSWANEGIAWHQGILAELDGSPSELLQTSLQWQEWEDIVQHQLDNKLVPLGQSSILDQNYNVEDQDYFAVEQLIAQYGLGKVMNYVTQVDGNPNAFTATFGESFDTFSQSVTSQLNAAGMRSDYGFKVTVKVLDGGPSTIYINRPTGNRVLVSGLQPEHTYTITCHSDGSVDLPPALSQSSATGLQVLEDSDWYVGVIGADGTGRQEFEIANSLGEPLLVRAMLYDDQGQVAHAYPASAIPAGLQLIDIEPLP